MSPELQHELVKKHPVLFQDVDKSPMQSCMAFGVEFGDGWYKIFSDFCEYVDQISKREMLFETNLATENLDKKYIDVKFPGIKFSQLKEKFGTMCVYWDMLPLENYEAISKQLKNEKDID